MIIVYLNLILSSKVQPDLWIMWEAAQMPHLTPVSRSAPWQYWARNPPTNASPAPLVSTIASDGSLSAGKVLTSPLEAATTGSAPWVMMTSLPLLPFSCKWQSLTSPLKRLGAAKAFKLGCMLLQPSLLMLYYSLLSCLMLICLIY